MKLFSKKDCKEGDYYPRDVFFSWGNKYQIVHEEKDVIPGMGMKAINHVWKKNGFYFKLEFPFAVTRDYMDPYLFLYRTGKCRFNLTFMRRRSNGKMVNLLLKGMFPIKENYNEDPLNVDRNLREFGEMYAQEDRSKVEGLAQ